VRVFPDGMDNEIELVLKARRGERAAFASLYDRYSRPVFVTLVGLLRTREDAEDALQAAFLSAWRRLPALRKPERFVSWLFRIARNKARDVARRRKEPPSGVIRGEDLIAPSEGLESAEALERLLASLRPQTRALVLLRAVMGFSTEEAAVALGQSPATIRRKYALALEHLRKGLATGGVGNA